VRRLSERGLSRKIFQRKKKEKEDFQGRFSMREDFKKGPFPKYSTPKTEINNEEVLLPHLCPSPRSRSNGHRLRPAQEEQ
jgi:hypothetical protein